MTFDRLDALFNSKIISHILLFEDTGKNDKEIGIATLYLETTKLAYYYYAFYDLDYYEKNLGMFMMTSAVTFFAEQNYEYLYLGSCYTRNALYKTQFNGAQFFNGYRWSEDLTELKYLINRESSGVKHHLMETEGYLREFHGGSLESIIADTLFTINLK